MGAGILGKLSALDILLAGGAKVDLPAKAGETAFNAGFAERPNGCVRHLFDSRRPECN